MRAAWAEPSQRAGGPGKQRMGPKRIILQPQDLMEFTLFSFGLPFEPFLFSYFSLLEWECLSSA